MYYPPGPTYPPPQHMQQPPQHPQLNSMGQPMSQSQMNPPNQLGQPPMSQPQVMPPSSQGGPQNQGPMGQPSGQYRQTIPRVQGPRQPMPGQRMPMAPRQSMNQRAPMASRQVQDMILTIFNFIVTLDTFKLILQFQIQFKQNGQHNKICN